MQAGSVEGLLDAKRKTKLTESRGTYDRGGVASLGLHQIAGVHVRVSDLCQRRFNVGTHIYRLEGQPDLSIRIFAYIHVGQGTLLGPRYRPAYRGLQSFVF